MRKIFGAYFYLLILTFLLITFIANNFVIYILGAITINVLFLYKFRKLSFYTIRMYLLIITILSFQIVYYSLASYEISFLGVLTKILALLVPSLLLINHYNNYINPLDFFNQAIQNGKELYNFNDIKKSSKELVEAVSEIGKDLPRHSSINYINQNSISSEYFNDANDSLKDSNIYLVLSYTGSNASKIIGKFTRSDYNHISISFDYDLKTTISYNGGEKLFSPGLNHEMIDFFNKTKDANILVYKLKCSKEQKQKIIDKVYEINNSGSSYNILGLIFPYKHRENIMYCSQFVYTVLEDAKLTFFKRSSTIKPTDFIEFDYFRKLEFCYKVFFNEKQKEKL